MRFQIAEHCCFSLGAERWRELGVTLCRGLKQIGAEKIEKVFV